MKRPKSGYPYVTVRPSDIKQYQEGIWISQANSASTAYYNLSDMGWVFFECLLTHVTQQLKYDALDAIIRLRFSKTIIRESKR